MELSDWSFRISSLWFPSYLKEFSWTGQGNRIFLFWRGDDELKREYNFMMNSKSCVLPRLPFVNGQIYEYPIMEFCLIQYLIHKLIINGFRAFCLINYPGVDLDPSPISTWFKVQRISCWIDYAWGSFVPKDIPQGRWCKGCSELITIWIILWFIF